MLSWEGRRWARPLQGCKGAAWERSLEREGCLPVVAQLYRIPPSGLAARAHPPLARGALHGGGSVCEEECERSLL